ncbi:MAG: hypothetical protein P8P83_03450 [Rickettsiaceae bacterium]|nr:hypothetical protein [Rickettsiaceae bacterium]
MAENDNQQNTSTEIKKTREEVLREEMKKHEKGFVGVSAKQMEIWEEQSLLDNFIDIDKKFNELKGAFDELSKNKEFKQFIGEGTQATEINTVLEKIKDHKINPDDKWASVHFIEEKISIIKNNVEVIHGANKKKTFFTKVKDFLSAAAEVCKDIATGGDSEKSMAKLKESSSLLFRGGSKTKGIVTDEVGKVEKKRVDLKDEARGIMQRMNAKQTKMEEEEIKKNKETLLQEMAEYVEKNSNGRERENALAKNRFLDKKLSEIKGETSREDKSYTYRLLDDLEKDAKTKVNDILTHPAAQKLQDKVKARREERAQKAKQTRLAR